MLEALERDFRKAAPAAQFCSLRFMREKDQVLSVRQDVPQPAHCAEDAGAMITVIDDGGLGYAATSDLSPAGLAEACGRAKRWARTTSACSAVDFKKVSMPNPTGEYIGPCKKPWESVSMADKFDMLMRQSRGLKIHERIVDWDASLWHTQTEVLYLTAGGGRVYQRFNRMAPELRATANEGSVTQTRTDGGARGYCRQGGMEVLDQIGFADAPARVAADAIALLAAPNCPSGRMDVVLEPDQMILQIHESIGHPLELDRILGDERNFAGTSFVTKDMFGSYRYGSDLLNISYDPTNDIEFASFAFDDDGLAARKEMLIERGILQRPLGGTTSQARAGMAGVANSRACSWNRPPIDRMANLNLEYGTSTLSQMIAAVKRGVYMKTNRSWSIDDSRNKFQFGCEWGQLIEDGKLTTVVRNPNYRGISATFWRSLKMVGDKATVRVMGSPFCGKGEPQQIVKVGHASPTAMFGDVEVFGGA
jgi:predicted Zn-dependent protease